ncbi:branched-chain amino acid ABC transporter permease [Labrys miyagiensis]|uniref:Branched-chain amino acid ABC transporter permease n=1 Tax=Labrys miyagiensis TaxID=346912 RepID=A0ABQ6CTN1_9HYPH|nr:branched-chain amino acid ABC transporter permease [Labrys miyagiensis]
MAQKNENTSGIGFFKDLAFWTAAAIALFVPVVGFTTYSDMNTNSLQFNFTNAAFAFNDRWGGFVKAGVMVAIVVAVRAFVLLRPKREKSDRVSPVAAALSRFSVSQTAMWLGAGLAVAFPLVMLGALGDKGSLKWIDTFGIGIMIYVMLGWGLNIVVGLAGLLDLGYVAFYAVGAYSYALMSYYWGLSFWEVLPLAGILSAFWGIMLGFPVLRLRGDYLAIVTLAFGEIIRVVLINWRAFTHGPDGITSIKPPSFFGIPFTAGPTGFAHTFGLTFSPIYTKVFLFYVILAMALATAYVTTRMRKLPVGRAWEALRENEIACRSLGINTTKTKLAAFATGAMFGGFAGAFFAAKQGFINPESFTFNESVMVLAIVVLGGSGSLLGVVIAAVFLVGGLEILRELDFLKQIFGDNFDPGLYRGLIFGLAMVIMMLWKPRGLISNRVPTAFLKERKVVSGALVQEGHG